MDDPGLLVVWSGNKPRLDIILIERALVEARWGGDEASEKVLRHP